MAKYYCPACGKGLGPMSIKSKIDGGYLCFNCLVRAHIPLTSNLKSFTENEAVELVRRRSSFGRFHATRKLAGKRGRKKFEVDEPQELFRIGDHVYEYANLLRFTLYQNESIFSAESVKMAADGEIPTVPILCSTGETKYREIKNCYSMQMVIVLQNTYRKSETINFFGRIPSVPLNSEDIEIISTKSITYRRVAASALKCMDLLQAIADTNASGEQPRPSPDPEPAAARSPEPAAARSPKPAAARSPEPAAARSPEPAASGGSAADQKRMNREILDSYRKLLDAGIITEEEFKAKEREIRGR